MKKILNKLFAVTAALLILSMSFVVTASAETGGVTKTLTAGKETYQAYKEKYIEAKDLYDQAKKQFESAKADYRAAKTKEKDEALLTATKDYMVKGIDAMIAYIQIIEANANLAENKGIAPYDASGNLNKYISDLEQKKAEVQSATTKQQLVDAAKPIKETWLNIRVEVKYYIGYVVNNRLEAFLNKANDVSSKFESEIQKLKSKGIDTTKLESDLATFNDWVSKAEAEYNTAKQSYSTHGGFDSYGHVTNLNEADQFLKAANKNIQQANQYLKKARDSFKNTVAELKAARKA